VRAQQLHCRNGLVDEWHHPDIGVQANHGEDVAVLRPLLR
jgi:hypothetical protein